MTLFLPRHYELKPQASIMQRVQADFQPAQGYLSHSTPTLPAHAG